MKVNINNTEIELKQSFRSHIIYEQITGEAFQPKGLTEIITFLYCVVMASAPSFELEFDTFVDWLDEHPATIGEFSQWMVDNGRRQAAMSPKEEKKENKEGKTTAKKKK